MASYVILTDSCCDLPAPLTEELGVQVVPLRFLFGETTYLNYSDDREMDPHTFYDRLRAGEMATTAAVNVSDYTEAMEPFLKEGRDVLVVAFSSALSTTYNSACIAAEDLAERYPQRKILCVDTLCASMGQGLLVYLAAQKQQEGLSLEELRDWLEAHKLNLCHEVTVDDLNTLKRGGRISATTAVVGSMLQIKPIIHVDDEGRLINIGKSRGRQTSLKTLADRMAERLDENGPRTVFISHGDCLEDAQLLGGMITERFGITDIRYNRVGPVIGAHTGPGVIALFYVGKYR